MFHDSFVYFSTSEAKLSKFSEVNSSILGFLATSKWSNVEENFCKLGERQLLTRIPSNYTDADANCGVVATVSTPTETFPRCEIACQFRQHSLLFNLDMRATPRRRKWRRRRRYNKASRPTQSISRAAAGCLLMRRDSRPTFTHRDR